MALNTRQFRHRFNRDEATEICFYREVLRISNREDDTMSTVQFHHRFNKDETTDIRFYIMVLRISRREDISTEKDRIINRLLKLLVQIMKKVGVENLTHVRHIEGKELREKYRVA